MPACTTSSDILIAGKIDRAQGHRRRRPDQRHDRQARQRRSGADRRPPVAAPAEGTLLPETYLFTRGDTRQRHHRAHEEGAEASLLARLWPTRDAEPAFKTQAEAITLASIVEKETAMPDERRHIAAVFVNRLRRGMKLQSDPTIIYGITSGYPLGHGIRESELAQRHALQHLRRSPACRPTPICNPGQGCHRRGAQSAARPRTSTSSPTGNGGHVFSADHRRSGHAMSPSCAHANASEASRRHRCCRFRAVDASRRRFARCDRSR